MTVYELNKLLVDALNTANRVIERRDQEIDRLRAELAQHTTLIETREGREFDRELAAARDARPDAPEVA